MSNLEFDATECAICHKFGSELINAACEQCWLTMNESQMRDLLGDEEFERVAHEGKMVIEAALAEYDWKHGRTR